MRKKIGKRIGPVPITLVAVFALAAFLSVGLLVGSERQHHSGTGCRMKARILRRTATVMRCGRRGDSTAILEPRTTS